jgi:hypothetical protein
VKAESDTKNSGDIMKNLSFFYSKITWVVIVSFLLTGCTTLVEDNAKVTADNLSHCSGSESVDDSSVAALPIPFVAFFTPHIDTNEIKADDYLKKCGDSTKLVNRKVEVNKVGCVPGALTRIITLGIWQWCPASVSYEADVKGN